MDKRYQEGPGKERQGKPPKSDNCLLDAQGDIGSAKVTRQIIPGAELGFHPADAA